MKTPSQRQKQRLKEQFSADLDSYTFHDTITNTVHAKCCSVCESVPTHSDRMAFYPTTIVADLCKKLKMKKSDIRAFYPNSSIVDYYTAPTANLEPYVLSPFSIVDRKTDTILVCKSCMEEMEVNCEKAVRVARAPPKAAIANGWLIGGAPDIIRDLSDAELALLTDSRLCCQSFCYFAGAHQVIKGWHTIYKNRPGENLAHLQQLHDVGLRGRMVVVLCGPFTSTQKALVSKQTQVRPEKVKEAFAWLIENNIHFRDVEIPRDIPRPYIIDETTELCENENVSINNHISMTVVYPDSNMPTSSNGGFSSQEELKDFIISHCVDGHWESALHARPLAERLNDFEGDALIRCFPLQFPYGHSGLECDPAVVLMSSHRHAAQMKRKRNEALRKYLCLRPPVFHTALFNLVICGALLKDEMFRSAKIQGCYKRSNGNTLAEEIGAMTPAQFQTAINHARSNNRQQYSSDVASQFLRSVSATCRSLPHTNEACTEAQTTYFSFLSTFGMPCFFLTVTPDDENCFRIVAYSTQNMSGELLNVDVSKLTDEEIVADFKIHRDIRTKYPGLCAMEYDRVINAVICHLFNWDFETQHSKGIGLFGEIMAWIQATEEQGRKTLHAHFLLFVKDWDLVFNILRCGPDHYSQTLWKNAYKTAISLFDDVATTSLFHDCDPDNGLLQHHPFSHECYRDARSRKRQRLDVEGVPLQSLRRMQHKRLCHLHQGIIASCAHPRCSHQFSVHAILTTALRVLNNDKLIVYPDTTGRLRKYVYESRKPRSTTNGRRQNAIDLFNANASYNVHAVLHATRCFKKGDECYAHLPEQPYLGSKLYFASEMCHWYDYKGEPSETFTFRYMPRRNIEDAFMNTHNRDITERCPCNTNILCAITGPAVFYVTCYNVKKQQKDERVAWENVARVLVNRLEIQQEAQAANQESDVSVYKSGFRHLLSGVYAHTNAHILAAPMAHYLALNHSRFRFSHDINRLPAHHIEKMIFDQDMVTNFQIVNGKQVPYNSAMNYLFRPLEMNHMCSYEFYAHTTVTSIYQASQDGIEMFLFTDEHPLHTRKCVIYRDRTAVPVFPWNFLPSTKEMGGPLNIAYEEQDYFFQAREQYCLRFLILFYPFRSSPKEAMATFQHQFISVRSDVPADLIGVANNIQNIYNSLDSPSPQHELYDSTTSDFMQESGCNYIDDDDEENIELIDRMANVLANDISETPLDLECSNFFPTYSAKVPGPLSDSPFEISDLRSVFGTPSETNGNIVSGTALHRLSRFIPEYAALNTLLLTQFRATSDFDIQTTASIPTQGIVATGSPDSIRAWGNALSLDPEQRLAFEILIAIYVLSFLSDVDLDGLDTHSLDEIHGVRTQLETMARHHENRVPCIFITGPAGAGKSKILDGLEGYARSFSRRIGHVFDATTIRFTSMTGTSATDIGGNTTAKECGLRKKKSDIGPEEIDAFKDTRMLIVDEISFAEYNGDLAKLSNRMKQLTECHDHIFGSIPICFLGDFYQLEPVCKDTIYNNETSLFWEQALTHMIELQGQHRFAECPEMQELVNLMREPTSAITHRKIINILNRRLLTREDVIPPNWRFASFATYHNRNRCQINTEGFRKYLSCYHSPDRLREIPMTAIVIKAFPSWSTTGKPLSFRHRQRLFEDCCDADFSSSGKTSTKRMDPFLTLYRGCSVMVTENLDVRCGIANGTVATFESVRLKDGCSATPIQLYGYWVYAIDIQNVDCIELRWHNSKRFQGTFRLQPRERKFRVRYPVVEAGRKSKISVSLSIVHFPVLLNLATTGHKLQGKSVDSLIIAEWSKVQNWAYVAVSRVKTLAGLFLSCPVPHNLTFGPNPKCVSMLSRLRNTILVVPEDA